MIITNLLNKYKDDKNQTRLIILLESYNKKATKKNIDALKLLIEDDDLSSIYTFLGEKQAELPPIELPKIEPNQDDLIITVKNVLGDPEDPNSTGNKILDGKLIRWHLKTYYKPEVLLRKFSMLAHKDMLEIDTFPTNLRSGGETVWECCILGMATLNRTNLNRVN